MRKRSYVVFGLGSFGYSLAETLGDAGYEVMVVDKDSDPIQSISPKITYAVRADVTDPGVLESLDISQFDVAVIAFTQNMDASIMATLYAKECKIPKVVAKAVTALHGTILRKVGADEVVFPERDMGVRVAQNLVAGGMVDFLELVQIEIRPPYRRIQCGIQKSRYIAPMLFPCIKPAVHTFKSAFKSIFIGILLLKV